MMMPSKWDAILSYILFLFISDVVILVFVLTAILSYCYLILILIDIVDTRFHHMTFRVAKYLEELNERKSLCFYQEAILAAGAIEEYNCPQTITGQIIEIMMIGDPSTRITIREIEVTGYLSTLQIP